MSNGRDSSVTFVFEVQGRASSGLNKSTINAHIARQAHQRRREKQSALLAEGRNRSGDSNNNNTNNNNTEKRQAQQASPYTEDYDSGYESGSIPSPVVLAGNSDPFSSKVIVVTPEVNRLLIFTRDFILPAFHANEAAVVGGRLHMDRFWRDSVRGLDDGGVAGYAYLARSAAILSKLTPRDRSRIMALQYLGKATSNLRKSIVRRGAGEGGSQEVGDAAWDVYALFCAEIAAGNLPAAAVHGSMLRRLLQPVGRTVIAERRLLMVVLQQDITRACLSLTRPSFDLHRWAEENLPARITDDLNKNGSEDHHHPSAFPFSSANLSPSLSPALRFIFLGIREWLDALGIVMLNRDLFNLELLINGAMKIMVLEGHLLNHYLDTMDQWALVQSSPAALAEACMALAALYWVRRAAHERMDAGSKLEEAGSWAFDMSRLVTTTLRDLDARILQLEAAAAAASSSSSSSYSAETQLRSREDRLWCLYVGTIAECNVRAQQGQSQSQSQSQTSASAEQAHASGDYHGTQLIRLATTDMHLSGAWSEVERVLHQYLYIDMISLKAKRWFAANQITSRPPGLLS
ncbi:uncharacterized protein Z520_00250 [Fonsecaea multimorphosa CBS 102226]|uniref:Transcription factor domain-containing protein n=1 Tax=Fonsecaea multimorphosa CBS 102226 TaxID=1442371 RepID=A0A0D2L3C5_9EURO|nr:uncharacterized protein Z520_00250 [Fonsecaea multimorphosa CBS 102226]KIY03559.1 hypothetical protein Z520_00250 [Fonsecaea multimorphosa CBS 102226]OAL32261.1 hypothetical protein AYO22_00283 [Fonsecaea multimorphosa]